MLSEYVEEQQSRDATLVKLPISTQCVTWSVCTAPIELCAPVTLSDSGQFLKRRTRYIFFIPGIHLPR